MISLITRKNFIFNATKQTTESKGVEFSFLRFNITYTRFQRRIPFCELKVFHE